MVRAATAVRAAASASRQQLLEEAHKAIAQEQLVSDLSGKLLEDAQVTKLATFLKGNEFVKLLDQCHNRIGDEGSALGESLNTTSCLKVLDLMRNVIQDATNPGVPDVLNESQNLKQLDESHRSIQGPGANQLAWVFEQNSSLQSLQLTGNPLGKTAGKMIGSILSNNRTLMVLNLARSKIGDAGVKEIATAMMWPSSALKEVNLSSNEIGDDGAAELGKMLKTNAALRDLMVQENDIGELGALRLASALTTNSTLRTLMLSSNPTTTDCIEIFAKVLEQNHTLRCLTFTSGMTPSLAVSLDTALRNRHELDREALLEPMLDVSAVESGPGSELTKMRHVLEGCYGPPQLLHRMHDVEVSFLDEFDDDEDAFATNWPRKSISLP